MPADHAALRSLASQQDSQFAAGQARQLGFTYAAIRALRDGGHTQAVRRGVWRYVNAAGAPDPAVTALLVCWPDGVISHDSAAFFHGLTRRRPAEPHVVVPNGITYRPAGIVVHHSRELKPCDVLKIGAVSYTALARTVCDLADVKRPWPTLTRVDDAIAGGATQSWIHHRATALSAGRPGVRLVAAATAAGSADEFRSWLERACAEVYRLAGLPRPEWNVDLRDAAGRIAIVDALWRPWRVVAEIEGLRFHTSPKKRQEDAQRFNRILERGFDLRRFTYRDIVDAPTEVAATVQRALCAAGADLDPVAIPRRIPIPPAPFLPVAVPSRR